MVMLIGMAQEEDHQMRPTLQRNEYNYIVMYTDTLKYGSGKKYITLRIIRVPLLVVENPREGRQGIRNV